MSLALLHRLVSESTLKETPGSPGRLQLQPRAGEAGSPRCVYGQTCSAAVEVEEGDRAGGVWRKRTGEPGKGEVRGERNGRGRGDEAGAGVKRSMARWEGLEGERKTVAHMGLVVDGQGASSRAETDEN